MPPDCKPPEDREQTYARFVALLAAQERRVRLFVRSLMPGSQEIDDVMQNVGLACWNKFGQFAPASDESAGDEFARWACVVARFEVLRHRRSCARDRLRLSEDTIRLLAADAEDRLPQAERERQAIGRCLDGLPDPDRRLLLSVYTPGESVAALAAEWGEDAKRLYRQVDRLRRAIADCVRSRLAMESP